MPRFPIGTIALIIVAVLIYFGLAQRVLDRLRLSDRAALVLVGLMIVGSFIDIPIPMARGNAAINVGGGLVPIGIAVYLLSQAGTSMEWLRALAATVATAIGIYLLGMLVGEPESMVIDPLYIYPIVAGGIAYIVGRSRRSAFVAATLGLVLFDIFHFIRFTGAGLRTSVHIGGGGVFDAIVLSGIIAVLLAELVGESRERLQGGPESEGRPKELIDGLDNSDYPAVHQDKEQGGGNR